MCLSQASVDPAGTVLQPGLAGPSWYGALARPHRTQLVVCVSQASRDPEGSVPQLGHPDPAGLPQWHGCLMELPSTVSLTVVALAKCWALWLHSHSVCHCGGTVAGFYRDCTYSVLTVGALFTVAVPESVTGPASGPELVIA